MNGISGRMEKQSESMSEKVTKNSTRCRAGGRRGSLAVSRSPGACSEATICKTFTDDPPFWSPRPITNVPSPWSKRNNNLWILPGLVSRSLMMITTGSCRIAAGSGSWGWTKVRPLSVSITKVYDSSPGPKDCKENFALNYFTYKISSYTVKPQRSDILPLCFEEDHSTLCRYQLRQSVTNETEKKETINQVFYSQWSTIRFLFAIHFFNSMGCDTKIVLEDRLHKATRGMPLVYCKWSPLADTY